MRYKKLSGVRLSNSGKLLIPTRKLYKHFADSGKTTYAGIYKKSLPRPTLEGGRLYLGVMVVDHQPPLITRLLLHRLLSIDNIYTLRQIFYLAVELHAADRIDALLGCERICRNVSDGRRGFLNHHLALYQLAVECDALQRGIKCCSFRLSNRAAVEGKLHDGANGATLTFFRYTRTIAFDGECGFVFGIISRNAHASGAGALGINGAVLDDEVGMVHKDSTVVTHYIETLVVKFVTLAIDTERFS